MAKITNVQFSTTENTNQELASLDISETKNAFAREASLILKTIQALLSEQMSENQTVTKPTHVTETEESSPAKTPSDDEMKKAAGKLLFLLAELQATIAKYNSESAHQNANIGQSLVSMTSANLTQATEQLDKIVKAQQQEETESVWMKIAEAVVGIVSAIASFACGQPELAVILIALTTLSLSGGMAQATKGLSQLFEAMGIPKTAAKALADATVIAVTILIVVSTCGAGAAATVEEGAEAVGSTATKALEEGSETAGTVSTKAAETASSEAKNILSKGWNKFVNLFKQLPKSVNLGIVAGAQTITATGFGQDLWSAILSGVKNSGDKKTAEEVLSILMDVLVSMAGLGAGAAVCTQSVATKTTTLVEDFSKIADVQVSKIMTGLMVGELLSGSMEAATTASRGATQLYLANLTQGLGQLDANGTVLQALASMISQQGSANTKMYGQKESTLATESVTLSRDLNLPGTAIARALQA